MSEIDDERVRDEIEALQAILMDDVVVEYNESGAAERIKTVVFPSTADDTKQQYVCITLEVTLVPEYPDFEPIIKLRNPRGLDDSLINEITSAVKEKCAECLGQPVIFELIELIRDRLTASNLPSCPCTICLYPFHPSDQFTKTPCYHYFHSYCLHTHLTTTEKHYIEELEKLPAWQKQTTPTFTPLCPVCREPIALTDLDLLREAPPPKEVENARQFEVTEELRMLQKKMAALFLYQQERGGIIDIEAEQSKLLLVTDSGGGGTDDDTAELETSQNESPAGPSLTPPLGAYSQSHPANNASNNHAHRASNQSNHAPNTQQPQQQQHSQSHQGHHHHHRPRSFNRYSRGSHKGRNCRPSVSNR